ncbi:hypothetical protein K469DRAFT_564764 [Zopfia rhizophila CBS 207.26]|uniref:Fork-head domain-containing protein n=1 Tax=Zopfia rhizophila CBS 207.26 TaxID=1314779 RepID=A0A6A6ECT8_9PEZI|nr:hypothetical protein K469DRAFT_564764 [Zopfia rhizophila CBS 207.26]
MLTWSRQRLRRSNRTLVGLNCEPKPRYEWAELTGIAILSSQNQGLRLNQIYDWISRQFSYYNIAESS